MRKIGFPMSIATLFALILVSCGGAVKSDVPVGEFKKITPKKDAAIYPLFSELYTGGTTIKFEETSKVKEDTRIYIWNGMKLETVTNSADVPTGANLFWRVKVNMSVDWFGWGIHVAPSTYKDMSGFDKGFLKFFIRTKNSGKFKLGIKHGFATESWLNVDPGKYGFKDDGKWCEVAIPLADFNPAIRFDTVNIYWMMAQGIGASPKGGSVYDIAEIYWTKK